MRKISKTKRLAFNEAVEKRLEAFGPEYFDHSRRVSRCMTDKGPLTIIPDPLEEGDTVATIFTRFRDTESEEFKSWARTVDANPFSGKWNIHTFDPESTLEAFRYRLDSVNARPLTDEENAAWLEKDRIESEKWSKAIQEFNE